MTQTTPALTLSERRLQLYGRAALVSATIGVLASFSDLFADSSIPDTQWSYPITPTLLWIISVPLAVDHVLQALAFVGLVVARPYGSSRAAHVTTWVAVGGFGVFAVAELLSGAIGGQADDSGAAGAVSTVFGVATLLTGIGGIVAGIAIIRRGEWRGLAAWSVLLTALVVLLLVTPANIAGSEVGRTIALLLWSLLFVPLGLALLRSRAAAS